MTLCFTSILMFLQLIYGKMRFIPHLYKYDDKAECPLITTHNQSRFQTYYNMDSHDDSVKQDEFH